MTQDDVRRLALAQPEAEERPHFERTSFRVRGKIFATFQPGSGAANLALPLEFALDVVDREPGVSAISWGSIKGWVRLDLAGVRDGLLEQLIPAAWGRVAPKRLLRPLLPGRSLGRWPGGLEGPRDSVEAPSASLHSARSASGPSASPGRLPIAARQEGEP